MVNKDQLRSMLQLQDEMNAKVNPQWKTAGYPFLRAVVIEGAEAIEHAGWKWWKHQTTDTAQLQMELVDIWHFALSHMLLRDPDSHDKVVDHILYELGSASSFVTFDSDMMYGIDAMDLTRKLEILIGLAAARRFSVRLFEAIMHDCGMNWDSLYRQYVGKNVLNFFRQDNGYKTGTYQKIWGGREDNEHLVEILESIHPDTEDLRSYIYGRLEFRYLDTAVPAQP